MRNPLLERNDDFMSVQIRQPAPDFEAQAYLRPQDDTAKQFQTIKLADLRGKWVCLFFYPLDFTFVCPTEIIAFNESHGEFEERNCTLLSASTDSVYSHKAWCDANADLSKLKYPMLADTSHKLSEAYGVLDPEQGIAFRGIYLIDPEGILRWLAVHDLEVGRNVHEVIRVLDALQTGKMAPCNWQPGDKTLN